MADQERFNREVREREGSAIASTDWQTARDYWRANYASRPYVIADRPFDFYEPGYRYGFEQANRFAGRTWHDVHEDIETGWNEFRYRGQTRWEDVKDAVRDAWDRVTAPERPRAL